jgi:hypothetical protein
VLLWKLPVEEWGWRQWKPSWFTPRPGVIPLNLDKRIAADGDMVYFTPGYRAAVSEIDGRTGTVLRTFEGTARTSEILCTGDSLILTVLDEQRGPVVKRLDLQSGRVLWTSEKSYAGTTVDYYRFTAMGGAIEPAKVDPTLNIATGAGIIALADGGSVVALDSATGKERTARQHLQNPPPSPLLPQQSDIPLHSLQPARQRVHQPRRRSALGEQLGARRLPHGNDASQRSAVCPAASLPVLRR